MEDFFDGAFEEGRRSISRNTEMYSEMDSILYGQLKPTAALRLSQQKVKYRGHEKVKKRKKRKKRLENDFDGLGDSINDDEAEKMILLEYDSFFDDPMTRDEQF